MISCDSECGEMFTQMGLEGGGGGVGGWKGGIIGQEGVGEGGGWLSIGSAPHIWSLFRETFFGGNSGRKGVSVV